ncbi:uncharacterized protein LOC121875908 [Homarus americanus]|uniref:uncharacterized protein LOC121875908 n=1 Tax=Homarus americanus TaxID=6706 RepID=UPI001C4903C6|nr:uncharacterized protein LOC121875908 [Homarus americanus]
MPKHKPTSGPIPPVKKQHSVMTLEEKVTSQVSDIPLVKVEKALNIWVEDMNQKHVPIDGNMLREKAPSLYDQFKSEVPEAKASTSSKKSFKASAGWLNSFRKHFNLKNIRFTGESATVEEAAARVFPEEFRKLIKENG